MNDRVRHPKIRSCELSFASTSALLLFKKNNISRTAKLFSKITKSLELKEAKDDKKVLHIGTRTDQQSLRLHLEMDRRDCSTPAKGT